MPGLTLDAGPLIAFERGSSTMEQLVAHSRAAGHTLTVPAVVVAEVWRGGSRGARLARMLHGCRIEPVDGHAARFAGTLLGATRSSSTVDALVVATAWHRGDAVLTTDPGDLTPLADAAGVEVRAF